MRLCELMLVALATLPAVGCEGYSDAYVAYSEPPPPRDESMTSRPGYVWVKGHWVNDGRYWRWSDGYYQPVRPGYQYSDGHWERHGNQYDWYDGRWHS